LLHQIYKRIGPPYSIKGWLILSVGTRGSAVGWGTVLQVARSRGTMALGLSQPLTEMTTRNIS